MYILISESDEYYTQTNNVAVSRNRDKLEDLKSKLETEQEERIAKLKLAYAFFLSEIKKHQDAPKSEISFYQAEQDADKLTREKFGLEFYIGLRAKPTQFTWDIQEIESLDEEE